MFDLPELSRARFSNSQDQLPARVVIKRDNMTNDLSKSWRELCIAAAFENDPERLHDLVKQINEGVMARQEQLTDEIFAQLANNATEAGTGKRWLN